MHPEEKFSSLYTDVSASIAAAMTDIEELKVEHKGGKQELGNMMDKLRAIQARFDGELSLLEKHSEWDKFTIAFFGETNAGKSTIIESLRILLKEDSRQQLLQQTAQNLESFEQALAGHATQVRERLNRVYAEYATEIVAIKQSITAMTRILQERSSARMKRKLWLCAISGVFVGAALAGAIAMLIRT